MVSATAICWSRKQFFVLVVLLSCWYPARVCCLCIVHCSALMFSFLFLLPLWPSSFPQTIYATILQLCIIVSIIALWLAWVSSSCFALLCSALLCFALLCCWLRLLYVACGVGERAPLLLQVLLSFFLFGAAWQRPSSAGALRSWSLLQAWYTSSLRPHTLAA